MDSLLAGGAITERTAESSGEVTLAFETETFRILRMADRSSRKFDGQAELQSSS